MLREKLQTHKYVIYIEWIGRTIAERSVVNYFWNKSIPPPVLYYDILLREMAKKYKTRNQ